MVRRVVGNHGRRSRRQTGRPDHDEHTSRVPIASQTGSPINIAVGPDRNIWFTRAHRRPCHAGRRDHRVSPDRRQRGPPGSPPAAIARPPARLTNRCGFTMSGGNKIAFFSIQVTEPSMFRFVRLVRKRSNRSGRWVVGRAEFRSFDVRTFGSLDRALVAIRNGTAATALRSRRNGMPRTGRGRSG